jgi:hypothetical protein
VKRLAFVLVLLALGSHAGAKTPDTTIASDPAGCPVGTTATGTSYEWSESRFMFEGWICQSIYRLPAPA